MTRAEEAARHIEDPTAYEHKDTSPKGVLIFFGGLFLMIALSIVGVAWLFGYMAQRREAVEASPAPRMNQIPPQPRLETQPGVELKTVRAHEDSILNDYGWENRNAGVVRIPIDRAMDLLVQRGLPYRTGQGEVPSAPDTGPESGGPQTGAPQPRVYPAPAGTR